jgi:hypothetical protein
MNEVEVGAIDPGQDARTAWYASFQNQGENSTYYLPFIPGY